MSFGFLIPLALPMDLSRLLFKNGKLVSWGDEVEELFAEIEPSEVYKLQPKAWK